MSHLVHGAQRIFTLLIILLTHKSLVCVKLHTRQIQWSVRSSLNHSRIHRAAPIFMAEERYRVQVYMWNQQLSSPPLDQTRPLETQTMPCHYTQHCSVTEKTGRRGFSCVSAVGSNLTTKLLSQPEVSHILSDIRRHLILIPHVQCSIMAIWLYW